MEIYRLGSALKPFNENCVAHDLFSVFFRKWSKWGPGFFARHKGQALDGLIVYIPSDGVSQGDRETGGQEERERMTGRATLGATTIAKMIRDDGPNLKRL